MGEGCAGTHRAAVQKYGASSTNLDFAACFCALEVQGVP